MMWLRKSKKGFTLVELMVVVAIIAILALLGLRLFLMQQIRAKNAIVKANAATVHTIIQGNLADYSYADSAAAVNDIREDDGITLLTAGTGDNTDRPAGMKNPHLTGATNLVVSELNRPATFNFEITNNGERDNFTIYSLVGADILPKESFILDSGEIRNIFVEAFPQGKLKETLETWELKVISLKMVI